MYVSAKQIFAFIPDKVVQLKKLPTTYQANKLSHKKSDMSKHEWRKQKKLKKQRQRVKENKGTSTFTIKQSENSRDRNCLKNAMFMLK